MIPIIDHIVRPYLSYRMSKLERFRSRPRHYQEQIFESLIRKASRTVFGRKHQFSAISSYYDFRDAVPVHKYEDLYPYIDRALRGERNVLWPGRTKYFSKSSGTTQGRSKYIPVTSENLRHNHLKGAWDHMAVLYHHHPDIGIFHHRSLGLGGSLERREEFPGATIGDISALMMHNMPGVAKPFFIPDSRTGLLPDWEEKIERTARLGLQRDDVVLFGGVPTWNIVLFERMLEISGKSHMLEIWPQLRVYFHGGVGIDPYKEIFKKLIPREDFIWQEAYNASEGMFGVQDVLHQDLGMLLMLDNSIFYEFIPHEYYDTDRATAIPLWEVEMDRDYVMLISTNAGLWRYVPGDVVRFSSLYPFRVRVSGRTQQFINAFGEELMIHNADTALALSCKGERAIAAEYTAAPYYINEGNKGRHEWCIEFEKAPASPEKFARRLDHHLRKLNSDYDAKRSHDLALECLQVHILPRGSFAAWLERRGRIGSQTKVPRLANHREYIDDLLRHQKTRIL